MDKHYDVVNLHNIIRGQEAKIHELREELRIANEREEKRYGQFSEKSRYQMDEKQKTIEFLKQELEKNQTGLFGELNTERGRHEEEKAKLESELQQARRKNIELEGKLHRVENEYDLRIKSLLENFSRTSEQLKRLQQSKNSITMEITQLNHFYKNSLFQIGKRKETLLWVDKFIEYLDTSEAREKKTLNQVNNFVVNQISSLRTSLAHLVTDVAKNEEAMHGSKNALQGDLRSLLEIVRKQCGDILNENDSYWLALVKNEKQSESAEEIKKLTQELASLRQSNEKQNKQLVARLKSYQAEKKELILGFQQLRSLTESKEANYKNEIKSLKDTINLMIQSGQIRDKEFEEEVKVLSSQIEHISSRYYENIDFPIRKFNERIGGELEAVKCELEDLQHNSVLKNTIHKFEDVMTRYVAKMEEGNKMNTQIESYMAHSNEIIQNVIELINQEHLSGKTLESASQQNLKKLAAQPKHATPSKSPRLNTTNKKIKTKANESVENVEVQTLLIDLREKSNKTQYEAILAKKHLAKLQEHCNMLEKKSQPSAKQSEKDMKKRIMELQAQNQALKEAFQLQQESHLEDTHTFRQKMRATELQTESLSNYHHLLGSAVNRIQQSNRLVEEFVQQERQHFVDMRESMKIIKTLLIRPMESFEVLAKQFADLSRYGELSSVSKISTSDKLKQSSVVRGLISEEIIKYKDLLAKRSDINCGTQRLLAELLRTMRQSQKQASNRTKAQHIGADQQQNIQPKPPKTTERRSALQKKLKEVQSQRIRDRQDLLIKVEKFTDQFEKITQKVNKSATLKSTLNKFQTSLNTRIDEIVSKMQLKLDKSEVVALKEDVIKDLRSKLVEANIENEGMQKEMSLAYSARE